MPRPTPAQLAYGSVTVICSTLAMLLLSGAPSGPGVAVIAVAGLALGLLVALTVPLIGNVRRGATDSAAAPRTATATTPAHHAGPPRASAASISRIHARHDPAAAGRRVAEPSLRP